MTQQIDILLLESNADHAAEIDAAFRQQKRAVRLNKVGSVREAQAALAQKKPHLVIAASHLPDGDFRALLDAHQQEPAFPIIVLITREDDAYVVDQPPSSVVFDYVEKNPATLAEMPRIVDRALRIWTHIVERRRAEEALRRSEERLRLALDGVGMGTWDWLMQTDTLIWSDQVEAIFGLRPGTFEGTYKAYVHLVYPEDRQRVEQAIQRALDGEGLYHVQHRILHADGSIRWIEGRGRLYYDAANNPLHMSGTVIDITARKEAEEALRISEKKYAKAFQASPDGIIILTLPSGTIIEANQGFADMTGYPIGELLGRSTLDIPFWKDADDRSRFVECINADDQVRDFECVLQTKKDADLVCIIAAERIELEGHPHLLAVLRDVTEKRAAEKAARQAQEELLRRQGQEKGRVEAELAQAQKQLVRNTRLAAIGQMSASIAHELRNPLGTIRNAIYMLRRRGHTDEQAWDEYLDIIEQQAATANRIIADLLEMSHAKAPSKQAIELEGALRKAFATATANGSVTLTLDVDASSQVIYADSGQAQQVFINLFMNAVQAMNGTGDIHVRAHRTDGFDVMIFQDSGPGVPKEVRAEIFEPLFTTKAKGTGLGLPICQQIAQRHGGSLTLQDTGQPGATFVLQLPAIDDTTDAVSQAVQQVQTE